MYLYTIAGAWGTEVHTIDQLVYVVAYDIYICTHFGYINTIRSTSQAEMNYVVFLLIINWLTLRSCGRRDSPGCLIA